jgi:hypothetical protein
MYTPLHAAAAGGQLNAIRTLINAEAMVNTGYYIYIEAYFLATPKSFCTGQYTLYINFVLDNIQYINAALHYNVLST